MIRGSIDSASIEEFDFIVELIEFTEIQLIYKFEFSNPLSISIGSVPDIFRQTILLENLFISKESGRTIAVGTVIDTPTPRQFPNADEYQLL